MIKKITSFIVLFLTLLNIPTIALETLSISISSPISYLLFSLLAFLIFTSKFIYSKTVIALAVTASFYFFFSALQYNGNNMRLILMYIKFVLYLFGLFIAIKNVDQNIIIVFLLLGAITILLDTLYFRFNDSQGNGFVSEYGRYAGFYLNPNTAAMICLSGYALTITKINYWKFLSIAFTLFGFLTLSRTFIATWFVITPIYLFYNRKYLVRTFLLVIISVFCLITFSKEFNLDTDRYVFLVNLFSGKINNEILEDNSRQDQWAKFYDLIVDSPIVGNGFETFSSSSVVDKNSQGVHNSFLLIFGEAGFLPFLLIISVFFFLFKECYYLRKENLTLLLSIVVIFIQFLVSHNFFSSGLMIFILLNIIYLLNYKKSKT